MYIYIYIRIRIRPGILYKKSSFWLSLIVDRLLAQKKKLDQQKTKNNSFIHFSPKKLCRHFLNTLRETNQIAPENEPSQKERIIFQPSIFRGKLAVSFTEPGSSFCVQKIMPKITRKTYQKAENLHIWKIQEGTSFILKNNWVPRLVMAYCLTCMVLRSGKTSKWQDPRARCSIQSSRATKLGYPKWFEKGSWDPSRNGNFLGIKSLDGPWKR